MWSVLIDTWWNVNYKTKVTTSKTASVLIDTWWNVNSTHAVFCARLARSFNRYMVECECS